MKILHVFNFALWILGAVIGLFYAHSVGFALYNVAGASLAALMWWLEPM